MRTRKSRANNYSLNHNSVTDISLQLYSNKLLPNVIQEINKLIIILISSENLSVIVVFGKTLTKTVCKVYLGKEIADFLSLFSLSNETFMKVCKNSKELCEHSSTPRVSTAFSFSQTSTRVQFLQFTKL